MTNLSKMALADIDPTLPVGYRTHTVGLTAVNLSDFAGGIPAKSDKVVIETEGDVRLRDDGTAATATDGRLLVSGAPLDYNGDLSAVSLISGDGVAHVVRASFYTGGNA